MEFEPGEHEQHWPAAGEAGGFTGAARSSAFTTAAADSSAPTASSPHPARDTSTTSAAPVSMNTADNARSTPAAGSRATSFTIATR